MKLINIIAIFGNSMRERTSQCDFQNYQLDLHGQILIPLSKSHENKVFPMTLDFTSVFSLIAQVSTPCPRSSPTFLMLSIRDPLADTSCTTRFLNQILYHPSQNYSVEAGKNITEILKDNLHITFSSV